MKDDKIFHDSKEEKRSGQKFPNTGKQPVVVFGQHKAKAEIGGVRGKKGGTVADHQPPADYHIK